MQIQSRLTLQFILIVAGIMLVAMFYIYFQFKDILQNEFYNTLRSKAIMTAGMTVNYATYNQPKELNDNESDSNLALYTENVAIYNLDYKRIYNFNPAAEELSKEVLIQIKPTKEYRFTHNNHHALGLYYTNKNGTPFIIVSEAVFNSEYLMILVRILIWVFIISLVFVALGGWVFAGQSLLPIRRIMNEVDAILPTNLNKRLEINNQKDELSRLVITFNKLLDRIQQAFNTQKLFLSNISHELKNPLSIIISQIEIVLDKKHRAETEYRQTLESVLDDTKDLNDVSDRLMQLAKINADSQVIEMKKVRIDELLWQSKAFLLKSHPRYKVHFEILNLPEEEEELFINGNEQLLKTALFNLMDNGCKYSPDKTVHAYLSFSEKGGISVEIQDKGIGIPKNELPFVFEPFYRSSKVSTYKGSGIGLSLVKSIMNLHNIQVLIESNKNIGTTVKLIFPT